MAQLVEQLLLTPENRGSNPNISKVLFTKCAFKLKSKKYRWSGRDRPILKNIVKDQICSLEKVQLHRGTFSYKQTLTVSCCCRGSGREGQEEQEKNFFGRKLSSRKDKISNILLQQQHATTSLKKNFKFEETHSKRIVTKRGEKMVRVFRLLFGSFVEEIEWGQVEFFSFLTQIILGLLIKLRRIIWCGSISVRPMKALNEKR